MRETILKILFVAILVLLFFKPLSLINSNNYPEIKLLNALNVYASLYESQENDKPTKFEDFVEFDPLLIATNDRLNIYQYYKYFDKSKYIRGYDSSEMTIHFDKLFSTSSVTYILVDGKVYIDNRAMPVSQM
jgi:hypothetical protein